MDKNIVYFSGLAAAHAAGAAAIPAATLATAAAVLGPLDMAEAGGHDPPTVPEATPGLIQGHGQGRGAEHPLLDLSQGDRDHHLSWIADESPGI